MSKTIVLFLAIVASLNVQAGFEELVKKTSSVYSIVSDLDESNPMSISFETLLDNQKAYLLLSSTHLNSSFYTVVNSDVEPAKRTKSAAEILINNLLINIDPAETAPLSCNGSDVQAGDTSCSTRQCTISQRLISKCNEDDCWVVDPSTDRDISLPLSESLSLKSKIEVSDCIVNSLAGEKHSLSMTVTNQSTSILNGGTIQASLILQNDIIE